MKILVKDIKANGYQLHKTVEAEELGLVKADINCISPLDIKANIERFGNTVIAKSDVAATFGFLCARCLEPVEMKRVQHFYHDFEVNPNTEYIDLGDDIRQELILTSTPIVLCKEDCKGLCPRCGVNLNCEKCECRMKT